MSQLTLKIAGSDVQIYNKDTEVKMRHDMSAAVLAMVPRSDMA